MKSSTLNRPFNRRSFLRGLGAAIALPTMETMKPLSVMAEGAAGQGLATTATGAPLRLAFVYFPNGAIQNHWWPEKQGNDLQLPQTLSPLAAVKHRLQVLGGLDHVNATPGPDGAGDHARASGTFLTGVRVKKTAGADIKAGVSIDQVIANQIGHVTRFPSLELSCDMVRKSGNCDSGYSCAYQYNLAWRSETQPVPPEPNPRLYFERLFGAGAPNERHESLLKRRAQQKSILDFVLEESRDLNRKLTYRDKDKLNGYLESVRAIEKRIEQAERFGAPPDPQRDAPVGIPESLDNYLELMFDMLALTFETDSTRVATFLMQNEGSNRPFPEIGISEGHHYLTHHRSQQDMMDKVALVDQWYVTRFARFLEKLEAMQDSDGHSVLHNSMIVYGSGNSDGNRHTHVNLPVLMAGSGGGSLQTDRFHHYGETPMSNFLLTLGDRMGMQGVDRLGDSTGRVSNV
jgi:hypothetical protein